MNAKSVKRAFGLTAAAVGTSGAMMLAPAVANAATAYPAHVQTVSNVSKASGGGFGDGFFGDGFFGFHHHFCFHHHFHHCCCCCHFFI
jgi:hypothetical protein